MKYLFSAALMLSLGVGKIFAFDYPASVNDTTSHTNPFFLQIWSTTQLAYGYHTVGIKQNDDGDWELFIGQDNPTPAFQLVNGTLTLASPEELTSVVDGLVAAFGPKTTDGDFVSMPFFFTNATATATNQTRSNFELVNLSDDGLYSILSDITPPSTYNGFKVCEDSDGSGYYIKYEGSTDGNVSPGCDAIALRTFFGPPFQ